MGRFATQEPRLVLRLDPKKPCKRLPYLKSNSKAHRVVSLSRNPRERKINVKKPRVGGEQIFKSGHGRVVGTASAHANRAAERTRVKTFDRNTVRVGDLFKLFEKRKPGFFRFFCLARSGDERVKIFYLCRDRQKIFLGQL